MHNNLLKLLNDFNVEFKKAEFTPLGNGHINSTFMCVLDDKNKYVLQKINNYVFKDIEALMNNCFKVTEYLTKKDVETIHFIKTKDGKLYSKFDDGYYRLYKYIDGATSYEEIDNIELIYKAGQAFGMFHKTLKGFNAKELVEVIPNFHNTYSRYINLLNAIKDDKCDRVKTCLSEIEFVKSFEDDYSVVLAAINSGLIPLSVTHNDPKINNVLFDKNSGDIRAVVDLDTIMPGSYLYDFGDALRSLFTRDNEDSEDLSKLKVNYDIFEAYAKGYLSEMKKVLIKREIELLPFSAFLLTIECGIRFLEDYLKGDVYFKTSKPNHNLIRARTQFTLAKDIHDNLDKLNKIIDQIN